MNEENPPAIAYGSEREWNRARSVLALDRTLLAWIRTSLALNVFGFALARFLSGFMQGRYFRGTHTSIAGTAKNMGLVMMGLGLLALVGGAIEYLRYERAIMRTEKPRLSVSLLLAGALFIVFVTMMLAVIFETGI